MPRLTGRKHLRPLPLLPALVVLLAVAVTDAGLTGDGPDGLGIVADASWSITAPGVPDTPKVVDYYFRGVHDVTVAGKQMVKAFFNAHRIDRAYFDGCSIGGRMAFVQAT